MKRFLHTLLALTAVAAASGEARAMSSEELLAARQCLQCHAVDRKAVGPSFQTISAVYRQMKDPVPQIAAVIRDGSAAHLGSMWDGARMPDQSERPAVSEREARQLARWILALPQPQ